MEDTKIRESFDVLTGILSLDHPRKSQTIIRQKGKHFIRPKCLRTLKS